MGCPAYADSHDLSGNTYPIGEVSFNSDTADKTEKILDKIDKAKMQNLISDINFSSHMMVVCKK